MSVSYLNILKNLWLNSGKSGSHWPENLPVTLAKKICVNCWGGLSLWFLPPSCKDRIPTGQLADFRTSSCGSSSLLYCTWLRRGKIFILTRQSTISGIFLWKSEKIDLIVFMFTVCRPLFPALLLQIGLKRLKILYSKSS